MPEGVAAKFSTRKTVEDINKKRLESGKKAKNTAGKEVNTPALSNIQSLYLAGGILDTYAKMSGALTAASGIKAKGKFEAAAFLENARRLELAAKDAIKRGDVESQRYMQSIRKLVGSQRAAMAASGVDVDFGSAVDIQSETVELGLEDQATIRKNAFMEAYGLRQQAIEAKAAGAQTHIAARGKAKGSLLTGKIRTAQSIVNTGISMQKAGSAGE